MNCSLLRSQKYWLSVQCGLHFSSNCVTTTKPNCHQSCRFLQSWMNMVTNLPDGDQLTAAIMAVYGSYHGSIRRLRGLKYSVKRNSRFLPFTKLLSYWLFPLDLSDIIEPWQAEWWVRILLNLYKQISAYESRINGKRDKILVSLVSDF